MGFIELLSQFCLGTAAGDDRKGGAGDILLHEDGLHCHADVLAVSSGADAGSHADATVIRQVNTGLSHKGQLFHLG